MEDVSAFARNQVEARAAGAQLRRHRGIVDGNLLVGGRVAEHAGVLARLHGGQHDAVVGDAHVGGLAAVGDQAVLRLVARRPSDVLHRGGPGVVPRRHAWNEDRQFVGDAAGRDGVHRLASDDALLRRALHVDDWRFAGHADRLFNGADPHVGVDRRDERAGHLHAFAPDGGKARQGERQGVDAGDQVDETILARSVGGD